MREQQNRRSGQSIVEMALILPFLLILIFGIIDMGWYVYGYATIYQAARNGAQKAAEIPPQVNRVSPTLDRSDACVSNVLDATKVGAVMFPDLTTGTNPANTIAITYPARDSSNKPFRALGQPVQIDITYNIQPLTPFWRFITFGNKGTMTVKASARRSIEALGDNPTVVNYLACN
jgi:Flp pilus assembly protein TadG